jgi:hypothetical protein
MSNDEIFHELVTWPWLLFPSPDEEEEEVNDEDGLELITDTELYEISAQEEAMHQMIIRVEIPNDEDLQITCERIVDWAISCGLGIDDTMMASHPDKDDDFYPVFLIVSDNPEQLSLPREIYAPEQYLRIDWNEDGEDVTCEKNWVKRK